jgi:hypothetical protein
MAGIGAIAPQGTFPNPSVGLSDDVLRSRPAVEAEKGVEVMRSVGLKVFTLFVAGVTLSSCAATTPGSNPFRTLPRLSPRVLSLDGRSLNLLFTCMRRGRPFAIYHSGAAFPAIGE